MIIDSQINSAKINIGFILTAILALGTLFIIFWAGYNITEPVNFMFPIFFILSYCLLHLYQFYYIYLKTDGQFILLRYMYIHPFLGKKKMVKIPYPYFYHYRIEKSMFGLQKKLVISYQSKKESVDFPPISISILTKKQEQAMINELDAIIRANTN